MFARTALGWTQYDPDVHCVVGSYIVWDLNDVKKTKSHDLVLPNIASEGSDLSGPKEVFNGRGRKRHVMNLSMLRHNEKGSEIGV